MSDQTLLSDLCSICNINKSKYRCPGCAARTCSLPCYKRHQQWGQCSGQRDPTKFVKKSQLVSPAGIDHDFNYLTGVERGLEKAERAVSATVVGASAAALSGNQQAGINYRRLEAAGVTVIQAPRGLSRQTENKSHAAKTKRASNNIVWTVEWIDETKSRMFTQTSSTAQIAYAQPFQQHKSRAEPRKRKKRKLEAESASTTPSTPVQDDAHTPENQVKPFQRLEVDTQKSEQFPSGRGASHHIEEQEEQALKGEGDLANTHPPDPRNDGPSPEPLGDGQHRFFLLRPRTSSSRYVLIPLAPSATLAESLHGRTVLEFPTIYVFTSSTPQLPEEFMLEKEYLKQEGEEQKEFEDLMRELDPEILKRLKEDRPKHDEREEEVDSKKILDVLKQDLGAF